MLTINFTDVRTRDLLNCVIRIKFSRPRDLDNKIKFA
jgi:hypothetical protein